jgi:hypothetical protein
LLKTNITDVQKIKTFKLNLKAGAITNQWWNGLTPMDKGTWNHLVWSFINRWPSKLPTVKTVKEKQAVLERTIIMEEEVGKRVTVTAVEEFTHVVWVDKVEHLVAAIPDSNGLLISTIWKSMSKILQKITGLGHANWASFCKAVHTATLSQIDEAKGEEREAQQVCEELKKLQDACNTMTRNLTTSFQWFAIGTPSPTPRFPMLRNQNPTMQNHSPPPAFNTNNPFTNLSGPNTQNQTPHQQNRPPAEHMADVI